MIDGILGQIGRKASFSVADRIGVRVAGWRGGMCRAYGAYAPG